MTFKKGVRWFSLIWVYLILTISLSKFTNPEITYAIEKDYYTHTSYETVDFKKYYYLQLDNIEKEIYNNLINSKEKFLNEEKITFAIKLEKNQNLDFEKILQKAFFAYTYDNPEVGIWFNHYKRYYSNSNGYLYIILKPNFTTDSNLEFHSVSEAFKNFQIVCNSFVETLYGTDVQKIQQIHDWLIERCTYDDTYSLPNTNNVYGTIINGYSVCSGFAHAFKYIAELAGLNVLYVTGYSYNSVLNTFEPHAWNVVYVNNKYFLVDVTFDNTLKEDNLYNSRMHNLFLLSPINDNIHTVNTYFHYPF